MHDGAATLEARLRDMLGSGALDLPLPAGGRSRDRLEALAAIGRLDLQVARLAEAHTDAVAILAEAGRAPVGDGLYGVWAAEDPTCHLGVARGTDDRLVLDGTKPFCTGGSIVDRALVTVRDDAGVWLLDVDARDGRVAFDATAWQATAFADTVTSTATFDELTFDSSSAIGTPGWYLDRAGFWHGACGPGACWAGGALGLVDAAVAAAHRKPAEPHLDAHVGALVSLAWQLEALVAAAGEGIDRHPDDAALAHRRAVSFRQAVERSATLVIDHVARALGPRPLAYDPPVIRRVAELQLYVRQHHAERDLDALGRAVRDLGEGSDDPTA